MKIFVQTSCGKEFEVSIRTLTNRQLSGLIEQNAGHPLHAALIAEQKKRTEAAIPGDHSSRADEVEIPLADEIEIPF
jgi:hypothetical protein